MRGCLVCYFSLYLCCELAPLDQLGLATIVLHMNDVLQFGDETISLRTVEDHLLSVELFPRLHKLHSVFDAHHL